MKKLFVRVLGISLISSTLFLGSCASDEDNSSTGNDSTFVVIPEDFKGTILEGNVILDASISYQLTGPLVIGDGATLTIPAGTKITAIVPNSYIAVAQGGKLNVYGSANNPVVLTSAEANPGSWGGLVLCGRAPINKGMTATSEVADLTYGGSDPNDSSGFIQYLRIEYAGRIITGEKEFNGLSMFGVGAGTTIQYVQAYRGSDDGFEWFGGTVNTSYLVSTGNEDDQFDWTEGWNGTNSNWFGKEAFNVGNRGIEADNLAGNNSAMPVSSPTINNLTLIGLGTAGEEQQGLKLREGTQAKFNNVVLANWNKGIDIQHDVTLGWIPEGNLKINGVKFVEVATPISGKNSAGESVDVSAAFLLDESATGAGNGENIPTWAQGWTNLNGI